MTLRYISNVTATWTDAGTTYTGLGLNVTASAYSAGSRPLNVRVNGVSVFTIDTSGAITSNSISSTYNTANAAFAFANSLSLSSGDPRYAFAKANAALANASGTFAGTLDIANAANNAIGLRILGNTSTSMMAPSIRALGYSASLEVMNKDATQNWYFGVNDDDGKALYIGRGYGSKQGVGAAIKIDISDRVTKPSQPSFFVWSNYASGGGPSGVYVFSNVDNNVGNGYSTSTGRFTAPVAGRYLMMTGILSRGGGAAINIQIRKNGTSVAVAEDSRSGGFGEANITIVLNLAAGDYVDVNASQTTYGGQYDWFSGWLLG